MRFLVDQTGDGLRLLLADVAVGCELHVVDVNNSSPLERLRQRWTYVLYGDRLITYIYSSILHSMGRAAVNLPSWRRRCEGIVRRVVKAARKGRLAVASRGALVTKMRYEASR
jgi:hypothetical protein